MAHESDTEPSICLGSSARDLLNVDGMDPRSSQGPGRASSPGLQLLSALHPGVKIDVEGRGQPSYEPRFPLGWSAQARAALALAILLVFLAARALVLHLGDGYPYVFVFAPGVIAAFLCGTGPAILAHALGLAAGLYHSTRLFEAPVSDERVLAGLVTAGASGALIIATVGWVIRTHRELLRRLENHENRLGLLLAQDDAVVEALHEGLIVFGVDGVARSVNDRAASLLGMTKARILATPGLTDWRLLRLDGSICPVAELPASRVLATGRPVHGERVGLPRESGRIVWVETNSVPLRDDQEGPLVGLVMTFFDVSDRVRNEKAAIDRGAELERLVDDRTSMLRERELALREQAQRIDEMSRYNAALVDKASVGLTVYTADGRCLSTNAAACEIAGLSRERIMSPSAGDIGIWRHEGFVRMAREVFADQQPRSIERRVAPGGGCEVDLYLEMLPFTWRGEPCLLVISKDLTDFRRAERELREASAAKSEFLSNMSHEIRTPLNAILGIAQVLEGAGLSPEQRDLVKLLRDSGRSLLGMLNDVLDLAKIEAGRVDLEHRPFELSGVIEQVAAQMSIGVGAREIEVVVTESGARARSLVGDSLRIGQVLANLVGNALKFTERGHVNLSVSQIDEGRGTVRLRFAVADTGIGVAPDRLVPIFEPFTQASPDTNRRFGGTGLGLSIARQLVSLMGGELRVRSREGRGSEFSFEVELHVQGGVEAPDEESSSPSRRVLVADDHELARESLLSAARRLGWEAEGEATGAGLLGQLETELAAGRRVDLVLLDAKLGAEDGVSVAREIRARWAERAPAVILLATAWQRAALHASGRLADLVLTKPVTLGTLREATWEIEQQQQQRLSGLRLLVADDGAINQAVAQLLLEREGARVECVDDGRHALAVLRARPEEFDLVLMDLRMPVMDGLEATRAIREELGLRDLPVVACTASSTLEKREEAAWPGSTPTRPSRSEQTTWSGRSSAS